MLALIFMFYTLIIVIFEPLSGKFGKLNENIYEMKKIVPLGFMKTFPTAMFSYICQVNIQDVYSVNIL